MRLSRKPLSTLLCILGLSLIVIGLGGTWGRAYGQTAGPTPTAGVTSAITVIKAVNPASGLPNDPLTFSIQIRNNDTTPQTDVVFNDRILDFLEIVSVSSTKGKASFSGQEARVEIGTLEVGETVTVTIIVRIRPTAQNGDSGVNIASVSAVSGTTGASTAATSNPVAISVGQNPPETLPGTGSAAQSNPFLIGGGLILLIAGMSALIKYRQPLKP